MNTICKKCGHEKVAHNLSYGDSLNSCDRCPCSSFQNEPKKECGVLIFAADGTRCVNLVPCFIHDPEENKKWRAKKEKETFWTNEKVDELSEDFIKICQQYVAREIEATREEGYEEGLHLREEYNDPVLLKVLADKAIREHDATYHPITKHGEMVKDDKTAREEWEKTGFESAKAAAIKKIEECEFHTCSMTKVISLNKAITLLASLEYEDLRKEGE